MIQLKGKGKPEKLKPKAVVKHSGLGKRLLGCLKDVVAKYLTPQKQEKGSCASIYFTGEIDG